MVLLERHGTVNASSGSATEGVILLAAAVETILLAGLALAITNAGSWKRDLIWPISCACTISCSAHSRSYPYPAGRAAAAVGQQLSAIVGYGLLLRTAYRRGILVRSSPFPLLISIASVAVRGAGPVAGHGPCDQTRDGGIFVHKNEFIRQVARESGVPQTVVAQVLGGAIRVIARSLVAGQKVVWTGFGTFRDASS